MKITFSAIKHILCLIFDTRSSYLLDLHINMTINHEHVLFQLVQLYFRLELYVEKLLPITC